jgi:hypothetical protein
MSCDNSTTDLRIAQVWALCALQREAARPRVNYGPDSNAIAFATIATDAGIHVFEAFRHRAI